MNDDTHKMQDSIISQIERLKDENPEQYLAFLREMKTKVDELATIVEEIDSEEL